MSERALEAVLFDAGGTLVRLDFEWMAVALTELGVPVDAATLRRAEVEGRRRYDATRGRPAPPGPLGMAGDTRAYFAPMAEAAGADSATVHRALERFFQHHLERGLWTRPVEGARGALDAIAALGLAIAVVSNSDGRAAMHLADCGVLEGVRFVVDSHEVGIEKPDPGIFRVALERLGVEPAHALFVGDILCVDEAGARAAGTRFVLIDPFGDYAPVGVPRVASIADLPAWIADHFDVVPCRPGNAGAIGARAQPDAGALS
jgi:HAD superfamily hydrolase (TIGR01509 family)